MRHEHYRGPRRWKLNGPSYDERGLPIPGQDLDCDLMIELMEARNAAGLGHQIDVDCEYDKNQDLLERDFVVFTVVPLVLAIRGSANEVR